MATITLSGGFRPSTKDTPLDVRTRVRNYSEIQHIQNAYLGMEITVLEDETNNGKKTKYEVVNLLPSETGIPNALIDVNTLKRKIDIYEDNGDLVVGDSNNEDNSKKLQTKYDDSLSTYNKEIPSAINELKIAIDNVLTTEQAQQLQTAYEHSQSPHVQQSDIPTKVSDLTNDSSFVTSTEMTNAISIYQTIQDDTLSTTDKTVAGAINEVKNTVNLNSENISELSSQLDTKANEIFNNQEDFCQTLKRVYKPIRMNLLVNDKDSYNYSVIYETGDSKAIQYSTLTKTLSSVRDEYILLGGGRYGELQVQDMKIQATHCDSKTGEWVELYPPSFYATEVGATMTKSFYGNRLDFYSFGDTRGGVWEFVIDGDTQNKVTLSTWRDTAGAIPPRTIFSSEVNGQHTVVATFKGDDPLHVPSSGVGTSRGWTYYTTSGNMDVNSFYIYEKLLYVKPLINPLYSTSNKEFAMEVRKSGTNNPYHFCPCHDAITAKFIEQPKIYVNGSLTNFSKNGLTTNINEFKIIQKINAINPETTDKLAEITTVTTFNSDGSVTIDGKYTALCDLDVKTGYGIMFIFDTAFNKRFLSSIRKEYVTTSDKIGTNLYMPTEKDMTTSFISLSDTYKNLALACTFNNPKETLRQGMNGKTDLDHITWLNYRDKSLTKLYQQSYYNTTINTGEVFRFSGTFLLAECENVYDLI